MARRAGEHSCFLAKGAVLAHRLARPLAAESDESEHSGGSRPDARVEAEGTAPSHCPATIAMDDEQARGVRLLLRDEPSSLWSAPRRPAPAGVDEWRKTAPRESRCRLARTAHATPAAAARGHGTIGRLSPRFGCARMAGGARPPRPRSLSARPYLPMRGARRRARTISAEPSARAASRAASVTVAMRQPLVPSSAEAPEACVAAAGFVVP
jgi:hypothetical protein